MNIPSHYIEKIRAAYPSMQLNNLEFNQDGMNNDVVIVNQELVCRFPKTDWAKEDLRKEVKILQVAQKFIDLPIPDLDCVEEDFVSYAFIQGEALSRNKLLKLDSIAREKVVEQLGQFLLSLHSIPEDILTASDIPSSVAERSRDEMLNFYEQVEQNLFPHLWKHQRIWVDAHIGNSARDFLPIGTSW